MGVLGAAMSRPVGVSSLLRHLWVMTFCVLSSTDALVEDGLAYSHVTPV